MGSVELDWFGLGPWNRKSQGAAQWAMTASKNNCKYIHIFNLNKNSQKIMEYIYIYII